MTTAPPGTIERVARIFRERLMITGLGDDIDVVDAGLLDSAAFMQLFVELETEFDVLIHQSDLNLDNFRTLATIAAFVDDLQVRPAKAPDP